MVATTATIKTGVGNYLYPTATATDSGMPRFKVGYVTLGATADNADTVTIDVYARFGMTLVCSVRGWIQTTADSVIAPEAPTTSVDGTNLTITVGGSTPNKKRTYVIYGI